MTYTDTMTLISDLNVPSKFREREFQKEELGPLWGSCRKLLGSPVGCFFPALGPFSPCPPLGPAEAGVHWEYAKEVGEVKSVAIEQSLGNEPIREINLWTNSTCKLNS